MREFLETAASFPTVVFSIVLIFFLGFWVVTTLMGAGLNALDDFDFDFDNAADAELDLDFDVDTDIDADIEVDGSGSRGLLRGIVEFLGIAGMPLLLALNLIALFSWATSMLAMTVLGDVSGVLRILVGIIVMVGSFLMGGFITGRIARRLSSVFQATPALRHRELVGSTCTVTTSKVTAVFGQAEVRDAEGGSLIVQVRCEKENVLGAGDRALIFDLDKESGVFHVSADTTLAN